MMKKVLLIENLSSDFYKARIPLAKYLTNKGWDVYALIPDDKYLPLIRNEGIKVIGYDLDRGNKGISQIIRLIRIYKKVIREYDFDVVHSFRFQPNLISSIANLFSRRKKVLHITGLGIAFSNNSAKYALYRVASQFVFQLKLLTANKVVVQNPDDASDIWFSSLWKKKIALVKGSGVNTGAYDLSFYNRTALRRKMDIPEEDVVFTCITRFLWEKGIVEMVEAFESINKKNARAKLMIIGWSDKDNPRHIPDSFFEKYTGNPNVLFLGRRDDIDELLALSDVFIYPSYYREGIPRSILEALSMSLPVITTDMPGCNLTVKNDVNGYLIGTRSSNEIEKAVLRSISNKADLPAMGKQSRELAIAEFDESIIFSQIEKLYQ